MRPANEHLTDEEILWVLFTRGHRKEAGRQQALEDQELEQHVGQCERCGQVSEEYRLFMSKLFEFGKAGDPGPGESCPPPAMWAELVTGLMPQDVALKHLKHAATCSTCSEDLEAAVDVLGQNAPVPKELQKYLHTATEEWQREFAGKIASRELLTQPRTATQSIPSRSSSRSFIFRPWAIAAVAALVVLAVGAALFSRLRGNSPDTLIRQAYAQQRTIEMRIPGAAYGPIQVERANSRSLTSSPRALLEAEVLIKSKLEKTPDDPDLLRQKAEGDLLVWNYQPAIETLNHAARIRPSSFPLLIDLATAYFERAEAGSSPADYEAGLEYLGEAIRLEPSNPAALFNRAILYERLYFYDRAIADWEQLLKIEKDPGWRKEAEQRLKDLRAREQKRTTRHVPENLTLAQFEQDVATNQPAVIEEYFETAERKILPLISPDTSRDENYRVATVLANNLQYQHTDRFLTDLLLSSSHPAFHEAANSLGRSSSANHVGHYEEAGVFAAQAAARFRKIGNTAGLLAAQFEEAYALQFESKAGPCRILARNAAALAHREPYAAVEVQLLLEQAICSNMSGDLGVAKDLTQRALAVAKNHSYQSYYLRGLMLVATLEDQAGDDSRAWSAIQEGLGLYWSLDLPPVRAYSLHAALDRMAERLGHANVQFAADFEALGFRSENPNRIVEASKRVRLGEVALRLGEVHVAQAQFEQAERIFAAAPQPETVRWRQLDAHINLARVQMLQGGDTGRTATALLAFMPEVGRLSNRYVEFQYYETLGELTLRTGDAEAAKQFFESAISIADTGALSLSTWREKLAWMEQHRQPYLIMTEMLLRSGQKEHALAVWEHYRTASGISLSESADAGQPDAENFAPVLEERHKTRIITYAFTSEGLMIWVRNGQELRALHLPISSSDLRRTAENFIAECARPDSDMSNLRADAQSLYARLVKPVSQWLPLKGHIIIEPDGVLGIVPFEALMDGEAYLGERFQITLAPSVQANDGFEESALSLSTPAWRRALVVAAPTLRDGSLEPPPGTIEEAARVAGHFNQPTVLLGRKATVSQVEKELARNSVFHFAGHAAFNRGGAAMLMADGSLGTGRTHTFAAGGLAKLRLAVFSACGTARASEASESNSLVSEFLHAGAHNVVATRWNVDSVATADFVELFYNSVLSGHSVSYALQSAAGSFRSSRERTHPYYWAAFSAFGSS